MIAQLRLNAKYPVRSQSQAPTKYRPLFNLTSREKEVLYHICQGHSMKEVAEIMYLSPSTIISHKRKIFDKFGVNNLVRLGVLAERYGYTD